MLGETTRIIIIFWVLFFFFGLKKKEKEKKKFPSKASSTEKTGGAWGGVCAHQLPQAASVVHFWGSRGPGLPPRGGVAVCAAPGGGAGAAPGRAGCWVHVRVRECVREGCVCVWKRAWGTRSSPAVRGRWGGLHPPSLHCPLPQLVSPAAPRGWGLAGAIRGPPVSVGGCGCSRGAARALCLSHPWLRRWGGGRAVGGDPRDTPPPPRCCCLRVGAGRWCLSPTLSPGLLLAPKPQRDAWGGSCAPGRPGAEVSAPGPPPPARGPHGGSLARRGGGSASQLRYDCHRCRVAGAPVGVVTCRSLPPTPPGTL